MKNGVNHSWRIDAQHLNLVVPASSSFCTDVASLWFCRVPFWRVKDDQPLEGVDKFKASS
jgi:hypothetical protein